jgi:hypothetical protein
VSELTFPLYPRRLVAGRAFGAMRSRTRGPGTDLVGSRPYRPGDDMRRIDWHASARLSSRHGTDEFVVREHLTEEATLVISVVDHSPSMEVSPPWLPWLAKGEAARAAAALVRDSAFAAACEVDDVAVRTDGPTGGLLDPVLAVERPPPPGSLLFVLSDFLEPPDESFHAALGHGWDVVPVVIQDPVWERSFPEVAGALLPFVDPASGRACPTRLSGAEVAARRLANEQRFEALDATFRALGLDSVVLSSSDRGHVYEAFVDWAHGRRQGARVAR